MTLDDTLVVLDTCVLLPPRLSDVLMDLRAQKLFSAHWTLDIEAEYVRNMQVVYGLPEHMVLRRLSAMKRCCPEWQVEMSSEDFWAVPSGVAASDRHVAAAALCLRRHAEMGRDAADWGRACNVLLLTENERDMARQQMKSLGVRVLRPGAFLNEAYASDPEAVERAIACTQKDLKSPPYTLAELLDVLYKAGARTMVAALEGKWRLSRRARTSPRKT